MHVTDVPATVGGSLHPPLYREALGPFQKALGNDLGTSTTLALQKYLTGLRARVNGTTAHPHFSKLRAFFACWPFLLADILREPFLGVAGHGLAENRAGTVLWKVIGNPKWKSR